MRFTASAASECFAWHWHPGSRPDYHLHVAAQHPEAGDLARLHLPCGPTSFSAVIRFLIAELDVRPLRGDWDVVLGQAEQ